MTTRKVVPIALIAGILLLFAAVFRAEPNLVLGEKLGIGLGDLSSRNPATEFHQSVAPPSYRAREQIW